MAAVRSLKTGLRCTAEKVTKGRKRKKKSDPAQSWWWRREVFWSCLCDCRNKGRVPIDSSWSVQCSQALHEVNTGGVNTHLQKPRFYVIAPHATLDFRRNCYRLTPAIVHKGRFSSTFCTFFFSFTHISARSVIEVWIRNNNTKCRTRSDRCWSGR